MRSGPGSPASQSLGSCCGHPAPFVSVSPFLVCGRRTRGAGTFACVISCLNLKVVISTGPAAQWINVVHCPVTICPSGLGFALAAAALLVMSLRHKGRWPRPLALSWSSADHPAVENPPGPSSHPLQGGRIQQQSVRSVKAGPTRPGVGLEVRPIFGAAGGSRTIPPALPSPAYFPAQGRWLTDVLHADLCLRACLPGA